MSTTPTTAPTLAEIAAFQAAHKDRRAGEEEYEQRLIAIAEGKASADAEFHRFCAELEMKNRHCEELSKKFVTWR